MKFEGIYKVERNGHELTNRDSYFEIDSDDIEADMTEDELHDFFIDAMFDDFDFSLHPQEQNVDKFIQWVKDNKLVDNV